MLHPRALLLALTVFSASAIAAPANPVNGNEFLTLPTAQPVQNAGKKVEVIEFFMYHCPACNAFEPELAKFIKANGDAIAFRRIHVPHTDINDPEAHLFLTLEAMQNEDALHEKVMQTWHVDRKRLKNDNDNLEWALQNGLDRTQFLEFYNSFSVTTRLKNLTRVVANYKVNNTPTLVIDGRYLTNPSMVMTSNPDLPQQMVGEATLQVVNALVTRAKNRSAAN
jgi:thiol:disulfide interchange protein DsbA